MQNILTQNENEGNASFPRLDFHRPLGSGFPEQRLVIEPIVFQTT